jgi:hypothetical protein
MASLGTTVGANQLPADPAGLSQGGAHVVTEKGLGVLLDIFEAAILAECGALYTALFPDGGLAVRTKVPFDVLEWDDLLQFEHPSLCISADGGGERVLDLDGRRAKLSTITVRYLLRQLSPEEWVRANGYLTGVENAIRGVLQEGWHPDYNSGRQSLYGEKSRAKYASLWVRDAAKPHVIAGTEIRLPSLQMRIDAAEIVTQNPHLTDTLPAFDGVDADLNLGPENDDIAPLVQVSVDL